MKKNATALDMYMNRAFKVLILVIPSIAIIAGLTFSIIKLLGLYEDVELGMLIAFDVTTVIYLLVGIYFFITCEAPDGNIKPKSVARGKIFIFIVEMIQWNYISYFVPSRDFWAYSLFFIALSIFFIDYHFTALVIGGIGISIAVSWFIRGDVLLPEANDLYIPNMILRGVLLTLSFMTEWAITFLIRKQIISELEKVADYDTLTLLRNRRSLDGYIDRAITNYDKTGTPFSVLMCDLDDFKRINDTLGHDCGDEVLRNVANVITYTVKDKGQVFRFGGEEILCLFNLDIEESFALAEAVRVNVGDSGIVYHGENVSVTITIGLTDYRPGMTAEKLIKNADTNLYYGKNHGKNCVVK